MVLKLTLKEVAHPNTHNQQLGQDSHDHQEVMAQTIIPQDNNPIPKGSTPQGGWHIMTSYLPKAQIQS